MQAGAAVAPARAHPSRVSVLFTQHAPAPPASTLIPLHTSTYTLEFQCNQTFYVCVTFDRIPGPKIFRSIIFTFQAPHNVYGMVGITKMTYFVIAKDLSFSKTHK